jgi:uncharacterized protein YbjQ (UPF0145 family)
MMQNKPNRASPNRANTEISEAEIGRQGHHRIQQHLRQKNKAFFTSDLSANEYLLTKQAGCEPIGLVMGTSFFKVGFFGYFRNGRRHSGELEVLTAAQRQARENALVRLQAEAAQLAAHGVIGVRLQRRGKGWIPGLIEFTAIGTAIRIPGWPPTKTPFTSHLSGQEFWALRQAGYWPKGLVVGACTYYIHSDQTTNTIVNATGLQRIWGNARRNQEVVQYSQGFAEAREIAASRLQNQIQELAGRALTGQSQSPQSVQSNHSRIGSVGMDITLTYESVTYRPFSPLGCFLWLMGIGLFLTLMFSGASGNPIALSILSTGWKIIISILKSIPFDSIFLPLLWPFSVVPIVFVFSLFDRGPQKDLVINIVAIGTAIVPDEDPPRPINTMAITPLSKH